MIILSFNFCHFQTDSKILEVKSLWVYAHKDRLLTLILKYIKSNEERIYLNTYGWLVLYNKFINLKFIYNRLSNPNNNEEWMH